MIHGTACCWSGFTFRPCTEGRSMDLLPKIALDQKWNCSLPGYSALAPRLDLLSSFSGDQASSDVSQGCLSPRSPARLLIGSTEPRGLIVGLELQLNFGPSSPPRPEPSGETENGLGLKPAKERLRDGSTKGVALLPKVALGLNWKGGIAQNGLAGKWKNCRILPKRALGIEQKYGRKWP